MQIQAKQVQAIFLPVKVEILLETKQEYALFLKLMGKSITIPSFMLGQEDIDDNEKVILCKMMSQLYHNTEVI